MASRRAVQDRRDLLFSALEDGIKPSLLAKMYSLTVDQIYNQLKSLRDEYMKTGEWDTSLQYSDIYGLAIRTKIKMLYSLGLRDRELARLLNLSVSHTARLRLKGGCYSRTSIRVSITGGLVDLEGKQIPQGDYYLCPMNCDTTGFLSRIEDEGKPGYYCVLLSSLIGHWKLISPYKQNYGVSNDN